LTSDFETSCCEPPIGMVILREISAVGVPDCADRQ
jgi:hypothetical protein